MEEMLKLLATGPKDLYELRTCLGTAVYVHINQAMATGRIVFDLDSKKYKLAEPAKAR